MPARSLSDQPHASSGLSAATGEPGRQVQPGNQTAAGGQLPPFLLPGTDSRPWAQSYPGAAEQLSYLRADIGEFLRGCPVADDVVLAMSELGANAVRHSASGSAGGTFTARLLDVPGQWVAGQVEDAGSDWDGDLRRSARHASGLFVLLALAEAFGVSGGRPRRLVWFRIAYPGGPSGDAAGAGGRQAA